MGRSHPSNSSGESISASIRLRPAAICVAAKASHASLTGPAGVLTGPGLDGLAVGDLSCITPDESAAADETAAVDLPSDETAEPEA